MRKVRVSLAMQDFLDHGRRATGLAIDALPNPSLPPVNSPARRIIRHLSANIANVIAM
jgi:hypothetical protein